MYSNIFARDGTEGGREGGGGGRGVLVLLILVQALANCVEREFLIGGNK